MSRKNKNRLRVEIPIRGFYPTSDDWSPNFPRSTVEYCVHVWYNGKKGMIRIVFRGADDTGMEKDFYIPESEYADKLKEIKYWIDYQLPNPITKSGYLTRDSYIGDIKGEWQKSIGIEVGL